MLECCCYRNDIPIELVVIIRAYLLQALNDKSLRQVTKTFLGWKTPLILLRYGHISQWDTAQVTNMRNLFNNNDFLIESIGDWDTSNVVDMAYMFAGAINFNQSLERLRTCHICFATHLPSINHWKDGM